MARQIETVMVLGGTGNLGPSLISGLSKAGFKVTILSRNSKISSTTGGVPIKTSDYTFESLVKVFHGQDAVVCATAATSIADQHEIIDAAVTAKVQRFVPNEFGADTTAEMLGDIASVFQTKREIVEYLGQKAAHSSMSWTAICTGPWVDWMLVEGKGLLGLDIRAKTGTLFDSGDRMFTSSNVAKTGEALAAVLLHPDDTKNQYVFVNSFTLSQKQVLEALERVSGSKFTVNQMSVADLVSQGQKNLTEGNWERAYYQLVTAMLCSGHEAAHFPDKARHWSKVLGLGQEETVDEMIERVLATTETRSSGGD